MRAVVFAVIAGLCWGVGEIFTKSALNSRQVGPMAVLLVRAVVTLPPALAAYLVAAHLWKSETAAWWREMDGSVWLRLVIGSGLMAGFAGVFSFYWGLSLPGGDISRLRPIAFSLAPASAVVLGWLALGEAMSVRKALAVVLIVVGIVMLTGGERGAGERSAETLPVGK
jgi:uncharacterized membrane protein